MSLQAIETRSVEDSLNHGHDAMCRAEILVGQLLSDLTAENGSDEAAIPTGYGAIVGSADRLAGRCEALVRDLARVRSRLIADQTPKATRASQSVSDYAKQIGIG